jgi:phosphosulfolactate synthase (CoM biosynthesis protein A)
MGKRYLKNVRKWRTDVVAHIMDNLGMSKCMFEAADPPVFK